MGRASSTVCGLRCQASTLRTGAPLFWALAVLIVLGTTTLFVMMAKKGIGGSVAPPPAQMAAYTKSERQKWGALIGKVGIKLD